ncbi:FCD domain-containing protein [Salinispirillum sp. LH 10-3-1]|uniref:FCD domain-containing protein n=1 Tax=Salinispirillum sp. LH 10-3-1 TaxID=2952525 RepID=A0AB38YJ55_9GAMM
MTKLMSGLDTTRRLKRADQIVESVKRWVVVQDMQPGERLPNEATLMEQFDCARGTVREALKSLEVQGLITIKTGPNGGAVLAQVPYPLASQLLRNFLHFQHPTGPDIYQLRVLVEPQIAEMAVGNLTDADLAELNRLTELCAEAPANLEERLEQRIAELEFHNVLADRCGNPLFAFLGRFLNDLIKDLVIYKKVQLPEQREFSEANLHFHRELNEAFQQRDQAHVKQLMTEHMLSAQAFNVELEGQLVGGLLAARQ